MLHFGIQRGTTGVTIVEVAFGVSIAALVLIFTTQTISLFINAARTAAERTKAIYLVEEGHELLRFIRDDDWTDISTLSSNTTYYLSIASTTVEVTTAVQTIDGYTRSFRISNVYRNNSTDDIVASTTAGSSADTSSKYITMTTTWGSPVNTVSITSILTEIDP